MQQKMWIPPRRYEPGDCTRNLLEIVRDLECGLLRVPSFQREFVWPHVKRTLFVERLMTNRKPIGVIATYEIEGDPAGCMYLNDGYQRLSTLKQLLNEPDMYGLSKEEAENLLRAYQFSVQHRVYRSHDEAAEDYKDINQGTPLTAYEFYLADLTNKPDFDQVWKHRIDLLHRTIQEPMIRYCSKAQTERSIAHRYYRHNFSLFYRYVSGDRGIRSHGVNTKQASPKERQGKQYIEYKLSRWLDENGPAAFDAKLKMLATLVTNESALIETEYRKVEGDHSVRMGVVFYRYLLDLAIWRRNNEVATKSWIDFLERFMKHTKGVQTFEGIGKKHAVIVMGDLSRLKTICKVIGSDMYAGDDARRASRRSNIMPGFDVSHVLPFSTHGEGDTFLEPSIINRSRGAKSVQDETEKGVICESE